MNSPAELERRLKKREDDLAELIDEVVFSEGEAQKAIDEAQALRVERDRLKTCVGAVVEYASALEQGVVVPALSHLIQLNNLHALDRDRSKATSALETSSTTRDLAQRLMSSRTLDVDTLSRKRSTLASRVPLNLDDAFVVCERLVSNSEKVQRLSEEAVLGSNASRTQSEREVHEQLEECLRLLKAAHHERDALAARLEEAQAGSPNPSLSDLQLQWHRERESLQSRVRGLEDEVRALKADRADLSLQCDESKQEATILREELRQAQFRTLDSSVRKTDSAGSGEHQLRLELDRVVREHSSQVTQLQSEIATLRMQAGGREGATDGAHTAQVDQLRRNNEVLRRDLSNLQRQVSSSSLRDEHTLALEAKVRAFESTVERLNRDLAAVDVRIADVQRQHREEKTRLVAAFDAERKQYQLEREQCDHLVLQMTAKLDHVVHDNSIRGA